MPSKPTPQDTARAFIRAIAYALADRDHDLEMSRLAQPSPNATNVYVQSKKKKAPLKR